MEFFLKSRESVFPCEVTIDEDNGRYMIRKADSSGEFFNSPKELSTWIINNWKAEDFIDQSEFESMISEIKVYMPAI